MSYPSSQRYLRFDAANCVFSIRSNPTRIGTYSLSVQVEEREIKEIGHFASVNEAVLAVSGQKTGYLGWDHRAPHKIPFHIHDISCWEVSEIEPVHTDGIDSVAS